MIFVGQVWLIFLHLSLAHLVKDIVSFEFLYVSYYQINDLYFRV